MPLRVSGHAALRACRERKKLSSKTKRIVRVNHHQGKNSFFMNNRTNLFSTSSKAALNCLANSSVIRFSLLSSIFSTNTSPTLSNCIICDAITQTQPVTCGVVAIKILPCLVMEGSQYILHCQKDSYAQQASATVLKCTEAQTGDFRLDFCLVELEKTSDARVAEVWILRQMASIFASQPLETSFCHFFVLHLCFGVDTFVLSFNFWNSSRDLMPDARRLSFICWS